MKDMILICSMAAIFVFGYFIMKKIDAFVEENQRAIQEENKKNRCLIRIAAETPLLIPSISHAMEDCSWINPCIEFSVSSGRAEPMLRKLQDGNIDILLLDEETADYFHTEFQSVKIPYRSGSIMDMENGFPIENADEIRSVCVLWNQRITSVNRDRVVFVLCNDFGIS